MGSPQWTPCAVLLLGIVLGSGSIAFSQSQSQVERNRPTFEVASIEENRSGRVESFAYPYANTGRLLLVNQTALQMIRAGL